MSCESLEHDEGIHDVLALCYYDLVYQLKPSFLYLGNFPEDQKISSQRLDQLWAAEGIILLEDTCLSKAKEENFLKTVSPQHLHQLMCCPSSAKATSTHTVMGTSGINTSHQPEGGHFRPLNIMDHVSRKNLQMHVEQVKPLEEYYSKQRKFLDFQVVGGPGETWQAFWGLYIFNTRMSWFCTANCKVLI
ncbi:putative 4-coumarate--CoA ligase-like 9-like [Capsicum annuum]|nr:putative 4-coumarate--CoA ligase-like 9-like [Capsicum annuum]